MKPYPPHITPYVMKQDEDACKAFIRLVKAIIYKIILVVDDNYKVIGILTPTDFNFESDIDYENTNIGCICNKNFKYLKTKEDKYLYGRNLFAESNILVLPILDETGVPVGLFARWQAFFLEFFNRKSLIRNHYAFVIMEAAKIAIEKGYNRISVIEFGVAGGTGLRLCEMYSKEIEKLMGVIIDIYGFDTGNGLLVSKDYKDMPEEWAEGWFKMDEKKLKDSLENSQLVIGDICETTKTFFINYNPAPIGVMLIDVDRYTPTVAILDLLLSDDKYFLPKVSMYFDDIKYISEFQGEALAIKEFNKKNEHIKIAPENYGYGNNYIYGGLEPYLSKLKYCLRFKHKKWNYHKTRNVCQLPLHY
ncbi:MAG: hypothetical protein LBC87_09320 [Fibromonadaceae bacterium]|nr:hypothetical protein [Fibromonadaceae bacterium]